MKWLHAGFGRRFVVWTVIMALCVWAALPSLVATGAGNLAHGTVTDADTALPIPGAMVGAYGNNPWEWIGEVSADVNGIYTLYSPQGAGDYEVVGTAEGYVNNWQYPTWDGVSLLTLDFALTPAETISSGTITDAGTGMPIAGADVYGLHNGTSLGGSATSGSNGGYVLYDSYPEGAGPYTISARAQHYANEDVNVTWDGSSPSDTDFEMTWTPCTSVPIQGADRITTAVAASQDAFDSSEYVVIATGFNWPDALGGSALAGVYDAPILLTRQDVLPAAVALEITRLGATDVIVLGSTAAVSANVYDQLDALPGVSVERIAGATRYETANQVAARTISVMESQGGFGGVAFVATGANFPDALGASPIAAYQGWPIYLANPAAGNNAGLAAAINAAGVDEAIVLGGTNVVAASVEAALDAALKTGASRVAGGTRYETAIMTAELGISRCGLQWDGVGIATGQNFPDALAGGVLQAQYGSVLLLTPGTALNDGVRAHLEANRTSIFEVHFLGGTAACSTAVRQQVMNAIN